jgi:hypothetical protein
VLDGAANRQAGSSGRVPSPPPDSIFPGGILTREQKPVRIRRDRFRVWRINRFHDVIYFTFGPTTTWDSAYRSLELISGIRFTRVESTRFWNCSGLGLLGALRLPESLCLQKW